MLLPLHVKYNVLRGSEGLEGEKSEFFSLIYKTMIALLVPLPLAPPS